MQDQLRSYSVFSQLRLYAFEFSLFVVVVIVAAAVFIADNEIRYRYVIQPLFWVSLHKC